MSSLIAKIGREYKSVVNRDDEIVDMLVKAAQFATSERDKRQKQ